MVGKVASARYICKTRTSCTGENSTASGSCSLTNFGCHGATTRPELGEPAAAVSVSQNKDVCPTALGRTTEQPRWIFLQLRSSRTSQSHPLNQNGELSSPAAFAEIRVWISSCTQCIVCCCVNPSDVCVCLQLVWISLSSTVHEAIDRDVYVLTNPYILLRKSPSILLPLSLLGWIHRSRTIGGAKELSNQHPAASVQDEYMMMGHRTSR